MHITRRRLLALASGAAAWAAVAPGASALAEADAAGSFDQFRALALRIARANIVNGIPIPSQAYAQGTWMRDAYWSLPVLRDRGLQYRTWKRFATRQDQRTGQIPTALFSSDTIVSARDDESTALFVLLSLELRRAGVPLDRAPIERAARYLRGKLNSQARVLAGPGGYTWWLDTLILAQRDTVAYTQGVTAVALRSLAELDVAVPDGLAERAEAAYAGLYQPDLGAMPLSAATTLLDVSCLVGEHLSLRLFDRPLLADDVVGNVIHSFRQVTFDDGAFLGFPVATQLDGSYMPESWFLPAPDNWPGHYHNGGSWFLYDAIALDAARRHGVADAQDLLVARIAAETRQNNTLHEYIATDPSLADFGHAPFSWRGEYAWNSYVATIV